MVSVEYIMKEVFIEGNKNGRTREQAEFDWEGDGGRGVATKEQIYKAMRIYGKEVLKEAASICDMWENSGELGKEIRNIIIN